MTANSTFTLVDTTLRDGEQTAGIVFSLQEKLKIMNLLGRIGIEWIEAGVPAMGREEQEVLSEILRQNPSAKMIAWNRAVIEDIEQSVKCGFSYIHVSLPISDIHIHYKFKKDRQWILQQLQHILAYVSDKNVKLLVGAEDASRADPDFFLQYAEVAAKYGAIRIRYADTIGCMEPLGALETFTALAKKCPIPIEFHGHNDFGLATANSLAAFTGGIPYVSVTSTGIGERAGNASLDELAGALTGLYNHPLNLHLEYLRPLGDIVVKAVRRKLSRGFSQHKKVK